MARREELRELLNEIRSIHRYIGARYVPKFIDDPWTDTIEYENLSVVSVSGTSYISGQTVPVGTPISDRNYWHIYGASSGAIINLQNQIDEMKDGDVPGSLQAQINDNTSDITTLTNYLDNYINPDDFTGTDSQKLQAAFDSFDPDKSGIIIINRPYTLDDDLTIGQDNNTNRRNYITVIGLGSQAIINSDGHIIHGKTSIANGGIHFKNITFNGRFDPNNRYDTCFDTTYLTRCFFENCKFSEYLKVFSGTYGQSMYFNNCYFAYNTDCFYYDNANGQLNDYHIDECIFERCSHLYNVNSTFRTFVFIITNSLIENFLDTVVVLGSQIHQFILDKNYLEDCPVVVDLQAATAIYKVLISNNKFNTPTSGNPQYLALLPNVEYVPYTQLSKILNGIIENNVVTTALGYICSFGNLSVPVQPIRWEIINNIGNTDNVTDYLYDFQDTINGTITFPGSITNDGSILKKSRKNGLVTLQYTVSTAISGATPQNIGSIPLRFAPTSNIYAIMYNRSGGNEYARVTISPNGNITVSGRGGSITDSVDTFLVSYFAREDYNQ